MSRYIDADALIDKAETVLDEHETIWFDAVSVDNIHSAPTIDAVSVVRCGECKHMYDGIKGDGYLICHKFNHFIKADDFCSYAERREP